MNEKLSIKTIRRACLECSGDSSKYVLWCPCDGLHSTGCEFWPFRLGIKPLTVRARLGDRLVTPSKMPPSGVELELLPDGFDKASTSAIDLDGYHQPAVAIQRRPKQQLTPEQKAEVRERLQKGRRS
jgi:hypothetical protein